MKFKVVSVGACAFTLLILSALGQCQSYTITDLGAVGEAPYNGSPNAINISGQIAGQGWIAGFPHAQLWGQSGIRDLDKNGLGSSGYGLDSAGRVVGESGLLISGSFEEHAVLWTKEGDMQDLGTLPGGSTSRASGIDSSGRIVGRSDYADSDLYTHAFLWTSQTGMQDLGALPGGMTLTQANAINNKGHIAGASANHACLWLKQGTIKDLGALSGGSAVALGLNDRDHVVGYSLVVGSGPHALLWTKRNGMQDLGTLPGGTLSIAATINNAEQIVGYSYNALGMPHAVLWNAEGIQDLNDLITANSGWVLVYANSINDRGQIVGIGNLNGPLHAYLLNPIH
jgi:probable HAF family extracellular repeat protein